MDDSSSDDPFAWAIDDVVKALCVQGKPWARDVTKLAKHIAEEEVDGNTLLTYEYIYSQRELMESLGIKPAGQKGALGQFIKTLRARSIGFRQWKRLQDEEELSLKAEAQETVNSFETVSGLRSPTVTSPREPSLKPMDSEGAATETIPEGGHEAIGKRKSQAAEWTEPPSSPPDMQEQVDVAEPKRRRIAPVNLAVQPLNDPSTSFIPTDADNVTMSSDLTHSHTSPYPWENNDTLSYLGKGMLKRSTIRSTTEPTSSFVVDTNEDDFYVAANCSIPIGRRLVVKRFMLGYLQKNSRKEAAVMTGGRDVVLSETASDVDTEYDLDDLPDNFDEETWREMQAEREEAEARGPADKERRCLTVEQVVVVLHEAIHRMEEYWKSAKLPRYSRKAYDLWIKAVRQGVTTFILKAKRQASYCDTRIQKLSAAIKKETWMRKSEVKAQARSLEGSVEDKLYNLWLIELYSSRTPPAKVSIPNKVLSRPKAFKPVDYSDDDGEDILSSDDEDFVVPDEPEERNFAGNWNSSPIAENDDILMEDAPGEVKAEEDNGENSYVDLTQMATPIVLTPRADDSFPDFTTPSKSKEAPSAAAEDNRVSEFTTPIKSKEPPSASAATESAPTPKGGLKLTSSSQEPPESYSNVEEIARESWRHWSDRSDTWRLLICLLWKLGSQARRRGVLSAMEEGEADDVYEKTITAHLRHPIPLDDSSNDVRGSVPYDVTRLFLSCLKCKAVRDSRIESIIPRDEELLKGSLDGFKLFHTFLKRVAPYFPEDSQIFRHETMDAEMDIVEDGADIQASQHGPASRRRTKKNKEVIRNKEAVDLRQRETMRAEEQEQRRQTLRQTLSSMGKLSSDRARLIINDTKKDEQGFVYVHEHMAKQIKDHQIEGVKFMWNQVLLHQGCLLAHTMGLGKTMQVITLLVAILDASQSDDESIRSQIPPSLRRSQTLVLCPAALVDNWQDELLMWAPQDMLGPLFKVDASLYVSERTDTIRTWSKVGGVLVIGYHLFKQMVEDEAMQDILVKTPNIVVADEAHNMKDPKSRVNQSCSDFLTTSRIALTGTPLANKVEEYHAMIEWVAPNFLGPISEFREIFARPIEDGLYKDSSPWEKRKALKYLHTLKETVAPKMHRATMNCMRNDLPMKQEFVLFLEPTELQRQLYKLYVEALGTEFHSNMQDISQTRIFEIISHLGLICNHPQCFRQKVELKETDVQRGKSNPFPDGVMAESLRLTAAANNPFLSGKIEYLLLILEASRQAREKVLVFSQSVVTLRYLEQLLRGQQRKVARLDGSIGVARRQDDIKRFNSSDLEVYLISTKAGGIGLNIQSASRVVLFDGKWNPFDDQQAIGRAWRIGQQKPVYVYRLLVAGTVEEDLHMKAVFKQQLFSRVIDKKNPQSWADRSSQLVHTIRSPEKDELASWGKELASFRDKDHIMRKLVDHKHTEPIRPIRRIMTTDTFEEEDEKANLTAEERKEAEELAVLNRLRRENPAEFERRRMAMRAAEAQSIHMNPHHVPPPPWQPVPGQVQQLSADASEARTMSHQKLSPARNQEASSSSLNRSPSEGANHPEGGWQQPQAQPAAQSTVEAQVLEATEASREPFPGAAIFTGSGEPKPSAGEASLSKRSVTKSLEPQTMHPQPPAAPGTPNQPNHNMDGAADSPIVVDSDSESPRYSVKTAKTPNFSELHRGFSSLTRVATRGQTLPGPLPITGANTFIRQQQNQLPHEPSPYGHRLDSLPSPQASVLAPQREQADSTQNSLFSHPPQVSNRETFRRELSEATRGIQGFGYPMTSGPPDDISEAITEAINEKLVDEDNGFLPDSRQWRLLLDNLNQPRFVVALISGLWTIKFVALAKKEDLEHRIRTANGFTDEQFRSQISQNLRSDIEERGSMSKWTDTLNKDEARIQQGTDSDTVAAEERTQHKQLRAFRLPSWANLALSESSGESGSRNGTPGIKYS